MSNSIVEQARIFATAAHAAIGQRRKYTNEDYIVHPADVVRIIRTVPHTDEMEATGWLHDVIEDTKVSLEQIRQEFGNEIAAMVSDVTDVSKPSDGNRRQRKGLDLIHTANATAKAKSVKLADVISNTSTIVNHDLAFARLYLNEKLLLLEVLKEGNEVLWNWAHGLIIQSLKKVDELEKVG